MKSQQGRLIASFLRVGAATIALVAASAHAQAVEPPKDAPTTQQGLSAKTRHSANTDAPENSAAPADATVSIQPAAAGSQAASATGPEIVVTAQKRTQRLIDVPITINVLSGQEIAERHVTNFQRLAYAVPELIDFNNGFGSNTLILRGISPAGGNLPLVGVYQDEVAVDGPNGQPLDVYPLDVDRVEVLNGPQGTLYGQGSAGGTVRFITRNPVIGDTGADFAADVWGTDGGSLSEQLTGTGNLPLGSKAAVRVSGIYQHLGGWIDVPLTGRKDVNHGHLYEFRVKGLLQLSDAVSLIPSVDIHRNSAGSVNNGEDAHGNLLLPQFAANAVQPVSNDFDLYSLTANADLGPVKLLAVGSSYWNNFDGGFFNQFRTVGRIFQYTYRNRAQTGEVRLSSDKSSRWKWAVGTFYRHANFSTMNTLVEVGTGAVGTPVHVAANTIFTTDSWSFYGNTSLQLTDRFEVGGGLRYFIDNQSSPLATGSLKADFHSLDPRVYASYKLQRDWTIYTSAAKGFRSGGFNAQNPAFPTTYRPEDVWSYEIGTKFSALNRLLSGEVSGFISRYNNMQNSVIALSVGLGYTGNVGRASVEGIDWSVRVQPLQWLSLGTTGDVLHTRVEEATPASGYAVGDRLSYIPKSNVGAFAEVRTNLRPNLKASFRVDYIRRGSAVFIQRTANLFASSDTLNLLNARVAVSRGRYSLELHGENLFNDRGRNSPNALVFSTRATPRTIGARIAAGF